MGLSPSKWGKPLNTPRLRGRLSHFRHFNAHQILTVSISERTPNSGCELLFSRAKQIVDPSFNTMLAQENGSDRTCDPLFISGSMVGAQQFPPNYHTGVTREFPTTFAHRCLPGFIEVTSIRLCHHEIFCLDLFQKRHNGFTFCIGKRQSFKLR